MPRVVAGSRAQCSASTWRTRSRARTPSTTLCTTSARIAPSYPQRSNRKTAQRTVIVPGFGIPMARVQHAVRVGRLLSRLATDVEYGIHQVAGPLPGHLSICITACLPRPQARLWSCTARCDPRRVCWGWAASWRKAGSRGTSVAATRSRSRAPSPRVLTKRAAGDSGGRSIARHCESVLVV